MILRGEKSWHLGSTAATLLAAYLLVLQGVAGGFAGAVKTGPGFYGSAICFNKAEAPLDRSLPARQSRHSDACCVFHCSGFGGGAASASWDETPVRVVKTQARSLASETTSPPRRPTLPVGSRAPPSIPL